MLALETKVSYLSEGCSFGGGPNVQFDDGLPQWQASYQDIRSGRIAEGTTRSIYVAHARTHKLSTDEVHSVPIVISLRSLRSSRGRQVAPLMLISGDLDEHGRLTTHAGKGAWIPLCRIATDEYHSRDLVVCNMDTYRAHQVAMASLPNDGSWKTTVERALDLFESIDSIDYDALGAAALRVDEDRCVIKLWGRTEDVLEASRVLYRLGGDQNDGEEESDDSNDVASAPSPSSPVLQLLGEEAPSRSQVAELLENDAHLYHKLVCGIPDHLPPLGMRDHEAIASFSLKDGEGVFCLATPKRTQATAVVFATMANTITEHALRGDDIPTIACVAPQDDLQKLLHLYATRPVVGLVALTSRWIPRIDESRPIGNGAKARRRTLGPLNSLFLYHALSTDRTMGFSNIPTGCLTKPFDRLGGGSVSAYADPWYVPKATTYYMDCVSSLFGERIHTPETAYARLADRLRRIDQDRCDLIDAYAEICKAYQMHQQREGIIQKIVDLRKEHSAYKDRLRYWESLAKSNPPRRQLFGRAPQSQQDLIAEYATAGEVITKDKVLIEDVCAAYRQRIERVEENLDRLRGASSNLTRRIQNAANASRKCSELVGRLCTSCNLTIQQGANIARVIEGRSESITLQALDLVLDQTVRPAEFWLAVHMYEAKWLSLCRHKERVTSTLWGAKVDSLRLWANLCPISIIPAEYGVSALSAYAFEGVSNKRERVDLALVMGSELLETARGVSISAMANEVLAVGTEASLGPTALSQQTFDELHCTQIYGKEVWDELSKSNLCISSGISFYEYARGHAGEDVARLEETNSPSEELEGFRSELISQEPVHPSLPSTSYRTNIMSPLSGVLPALSYVLVPDSSWTQIGPSRQNHAEALAIARWLRNHLEELKEAYMFDSSHPLCVACPYEAQAALVSKTLTKLLPMKETPWEVRTIAEFCDDTWPVVILCSTCGPVALGDSSHMSANKVLALCAAAADEALVLFFGGAWIRSTEDVAVKTLRRAFRVGRLFSKPHRKQMRHSEKAKGALQPQPDLRATPLSLQALLTMLFERGDLDRVPDARRVMLALIKVGLIQSTDGSESESSVRPTAAGREIGIVASKDRVGLTSCTFSDASVAVIASLVQSMEEDNA